MTRAAGRGTSGAGWRRDVLGPGFRCRTLDLGEDEEGPLRAVAVRCLPGPSACRGAERAAREHRVPVLLVHGWSDYVLDRRLMLHLYALGFDVWGVDLRKHGRSLLPGQTPTAVGDLSEYDAEIGAMLDLIGRDRPPVLLGHSTGGLTAALWAQRRPGTVRALVLNSPWLEFHAGAAAREAIRPALRALAQRAPMARVLPRGSMHYTRTTHVLFGGETPYSLRWKPPGGHDFPACTLSAVLEGQARLRRGGPLAVPALVLHSARSVFGLRFRSDMAEADVVLNVRTIAAAARQLGPLVRIEPVDGARHDVFLSAPAVRRRALEIVEEWLRELPDIGPTMSRDAPPGRP